jgi:hypothetical protein
MIYHKITVCYVNLWNIPLKEKKIIYVDQDVILTKDRTEIAT